MRAVAQTLLQAGLLCLVPLASGVPDDLPTVPPGGVVRWSAPETTHCRMGSTSWEPIAATCWYPIDLLTPPGERELVREIGGRREKRLVRIAAYPYPVETITIADQRLVDPEPLDLKRIAAEQSRVGALWSRRGSRRFELPLHPPLAQLPAGGRFGTKRVFNGEPRSPHNGADYPAPAGTPVLAVAAGTVVLAEPHFFAGNSVFIDHGDGLISMVFHLAEIRVAVAQDLAAGETIGLVGSTGRATGPHLHFGLRWRGARIDPAMLLSPPAAVELTR